MTPVELDRPKPFYNIHVFMCTNRRPDGHQRGSCAAGGSEVLRDYMKVRAKELGLASTRINTAGCLDRCGLGPCIVVYPEGSWYRVSTKAEVDIVMEHLANGTKAIDLMLPT